MQNPSSAVMIIFLFTWPTDSHNLHQQIHCLLFYHKWPNFHFSLFYKFFCIVGIHPFRKIRLPEIMFLNIGKCKFRCFILSCQNCLRIAKIYIYVGAGSYLVDLQCSDKIEPIKQHVSENSNLWLD